MDDLTSSVRAAADGAAHANTLVEGARQYAEASGEVVREAVKAMDEIASSSQQISKIIGVIDVIALQTNLLALNPGVEAPRAGESGRGFAVVASEVRALTRRSSEAARETSGLISASGSQVNCGVDLVDKAGKALKVIVEHVVEISRNVSEIASSSREENRGRLGAAFSPFPDKSPGTRERPPSALGAGPISAQNCLSTVAQDAAAQPVEAAIRRT